MPLTELPNELMLYLCCFTPNRSNASLARTSKTLNRIVTPLLYEKLDLQKMSQAWHCMNTLQSSQRNLPFLVKSMTLPKVNWWLVSSDIRESFHQLFVRCVLRMQNLQEFNCPVPAQMLPDMWIALCGNKSLRSIRVSLPSVDELEGVDLSALPHTNLTLPHLHTFEFTQVDMKPHISLHPIYEAFISSLIKRHAHQLRIIHVETESNSPDYLTRLLPRGEDALPLLDDITTKSSFLTSKMLAQFRSVRSITLFTPSTSSPLPPFSRYCLPHLQTFAGPSDVLKSLLDPRSKRPIHTLHLNGAFFQDSPPQGLSALREIEWTEFSEQITSLPNSYTSVRHLSFYCQSIDFKILPEIAPYICTLESLTICLSSEPRNVSNVQIITSSKQCLTTSGKCNCTIFTEIL
ncbi:hypothetical protein NLI96_g8409 [Meripilus lineatus]|uniref:F-box domain-containing protein n=1 Tax=Meripilus lineatus TaxID=2056292 RepID=A0AAD5YE00_9APHY|nr:hypothetical protein NLI96_g8409 [Physisporinus lineatus]